MAKSKRTGAVKENKPPESIPQLLWMMLKGIVAGFRHHLLFMVLMGAAVFVAIQFLNYWAVAIKNEGFGGGPVNDPNNPLYGFFNAGKNTHVFNLWVFLGGLLLATLIGHIRATGFKRFFQELFHVFHWTGFCVSKAKRWSLPALLFSAGLTVALGIVFNSLPLFITIAVGQFFAFISQNGGLTSLFARCGWFDIQHVFRSKHPRTDINEGVSGFLPLGMMFGALLLCIIPPQQLRLFSILLLLVFVTLGILTARKAVPPQVVATLLLMIVVQLLWLRLFGRVFADDGGDQEVGGNIFDYAKDPGGRIVLGNGVKSGIFGTLGTFIGSGFSFVARTATGVAGAVVSTVSSAAGAVSDAVVSTGKTVLKKAAEYTEGISDSVSQNSSAILNKAREGYEIGKEFISITIDDYEAAKKFAGELANDAVQLGKDLVNPEIMVRTVGESMGDFVRGVKDVWNSPEIIWNTMTGSLETGVEMGKAVLGGIWKTVTDPRKAFEFIKDSVGINDYAKSQDPNIPAHERIGHSLVGTFKLGMTLATMGQAKTATIALKTALQQGLKTAPTKAALLRNTLSKLLAKKPPVPKSRLVPRRTGVPTRPPRSVVRPKTPVRYNYKPSGKPADLSGMTKKSQKAFQVASDEMGLKAHTRAPNRYTPQQRAHGNCQPKPEPLKMKTLDYIDNFLGGPPHSEGVVGLYKPKMPPKDVMRSLHPKTQKEIVKRFKQQSRAWRKYADNMPDGFEHRKGIVYKKGTRTRFTSDNDVYDITDLEGRPVSRQVGDAYLKRAKELGADIEHGYHMDWKTAGGGARKAKLGIINRAREGQEGLITFSPNSRPTHSYMEGRQIKIKQ